MGRCKSHKCHTIKLTTEFIILVQILSIQYDHIFKSKDNSLSLQYGRKEMLEYFLRKRQTSENGHLKLNFSTEEHPMRHSIASVYKVLQITVTTHCQLDQGQLRLSMIMNKCDMLCIKHSNEEIFVGFKKPYVFLCGWKYERRDKGTRKKQKDKVTEQQRLCSTVKARKVFLKTILTKGQKCKREMVSNI